MPSPRAIFIPGHGVAERVRAVRFIPYPGRGDVAGSSGRPGGPPLPSTVEIWPANYYGDPEGDMLTSRSVSDRTEFVFSENEMPVVPAERSLLVVIRDPPGRWDVEFDSVFENLNGTSVSRRITVDNFGTARESIEDQGVQRAAIARPAA
jgi:hypothetical protein